MTKDLTVFNFNGKKVRSIIVDDKPYFVAKDVAEILGYATAETMTRRLDDDEKTTTPFRGSGSNYQTNITLINESGLYNAIIGSQKPEAKAFKKWVTSEVLPSIRKIGQYSKVNYNDISEKAKLELQTLPVIFESFRISDSGKAVLFKKYYNEYGLNTNLIPSYVEENITESLTALLKKNNIKLSAQKVNTLLLESGIIEQKTRKSSNGTDKAFYCLTESGLKYGKNLVNPQNPKETQPHYYNDTFLELINKIIKS